MNTSIFYTQYLSSQPTPMVDLSSYGFPRVLKTQEVNPQFNATISYGDISIFIPAHTFDQTNNIDLLGGDANYFLQPNTASQTIFDAFALRIRNPQNTLVFSLHNPMQVTITNHLISDQSNLLGATPTNPARLILLQNPPMITNHTIKFSLTRLDLGLVATSPAPPTLPTATAQMPAILIILVLVILMLLAIGVIIKGIFD